MSNTRRLPEFMTVKSVGLTLAVILFFLPFLFPAEGLTVAGNRMLSIFLMAVALWITEAIPLHATAALIIFLNILLISNRALVPPADFDAPAFSRFFSTLASPILMLFLGGFFLADGAAKYKLDRNLAKTLLKPFGTKPSNIILGMMLIVAVFSMFMSNTAATAAFMAVVLPVIARLPEGDRGRVALALCIPIAANVGGMGTPVGTPPNAIALGALNRMGIQISFIEWMAMIFPFMLIVLLSAWQLLTRIFPCSAKEIVIQIEGEYDRSLPAILFYIIAGGTLLLWFTEPLHGVPSSIVGFFPVVSMLALKLISEKEFHSMQWSVLWLVAGGIALGLGVGETGLDEWLIGLIAWDNLPVAAVTALLALTALAFSTIISNSATANLMIPIAMTLSVSIGDDLNRIGAAVFVAVGASLAMMLPISTPPNAIAYASGQVKTKQMAIMGACVGTIGMLVFIFIAPHVWEWLGLMPEYSTETLVQ